MEIMQLSKVSEKDCLVQLRIDTISKFCEKYVDGVQQLSF